MKVTRKDATVMAPTDDAFPGTFEAILSAPTKDRDGETLLPSEWKQPLPDHITVDIDHTMSVEGTVGSAKPWIDEKGNLRISGTFASTAKAQEVRTLMQEGHVNRTSVAFMTEKTVKDGKSVPVRELLNAAIVAIPSNREAVILEAKGAKAGARNSAADLANIQGIHDSAVSLGAGCAAAKSHRPADVKHPTVLEALGLLESEDVDTLPAVVQQAITLLRGIDVEERQDLDEVPATDGDADTAADPVPATAATEVAPVAATRSAPVEDDPTSTLNAARARFYATLSGRN